MTGDRIAPVIEGVKIRYASTHPDERGSITEIFNPAWGLDDHPMVYLYEFTIRPSKAKGWIVHEHQDDRIFLAHGAVKFVLYDSRSDSPTYRMVNEFFLSDQNRGVIRYPAGVYHALENVGETVARLYNFPTRPYNHEHPDKLRLPLNNDIIPYRFENTSGW